jgi:hypothetical protein
MGIGSILVGISLLTVVVAYLARPFRASSSQISDRAIEAWVAQARKEEGVPRAVEIEREAPSEETAREEVINYCPQCGRRVSTDDRFCSGCGRELSRGAR